MISGGNTLLESSSATNSPTGSMVAYDVQTGRPIWSLHGNNPITLGDLTTNLTALLVSSTADHQDDMIEAVNPITGRVAWRAPDREPFGNPYISEQTDTIVVQDQTKNGEPRGVTVIDGHTGKVAWQRSGGLWWMVSNPDVLDQQVTGRISAIRLTDGRTLGSAPLPAGSHLLAVPGTPALLLVQPPSGPTTAYIALGLKPLWQATLPTNMPMAYGLGHRVILRNFQTGEMVAYDAATGKQVWRYRQAHKAVNVGWEPSLQNGDTLLLSYPPDLYHYTFDALDAVTGRVLWSRTLPSVNSDLVAAGEGVDYLLTQSDAAGANWEIIAVDRDTGTTLWTRSISPGLDAKGNPCSDDTALAIPNALIVNADCGFAMLHS